MGVLSNVERASVGEVREMLFSFPKGHLTAQNLLCWLVFILLVRIVLTVRRFWQNSNSELRLTTRNTEEFSTNI